MGEGSLWDRPSCMSSEFLRALLPSDDIKNFLIAGSLYSHTAAKLFFIRLFRKSIHLHEHTVKGWGVWTILIIICNGVAFVLAVGVPVSSPLQDSASEHHD